MKVAPIPSVPLALTMMT